MPSRDSKLTARMSTRMSAEITVTAWTSPTSSMPVKPDADFKLCRGFACPIRLHHTVSVAGEEVGGVGAVAAVDFNTTADGDESEHVVTGNGVAASGEPIVQCLLRVANQQHVTSPSFSGHGCCRLGVVGSATSLTAAARAHGPIPVCRISST